MSHDKDSLLLSEFKKAIAKNSNAPYSNLDDSFNEQFDFFIKRYEDIMEVTGTHIPPHKWSYHRIGLVTGGQAAYTSGMYRFTARKNTLLIIPARMITTSDWSMDGSGYNLLFNFDFLLQHNLSYKPGILLPSTQPFLMLKNEQAHQLEPIFRTILQEKASSNSLRNQLIALKIVELLVLCDRFYSELHEIQDSPHSVELLNHFTDLIEEHFASEHSVSFYAAKLHIHPNYLNSIVKSGTGTTAKESIQNRLILEAKYLLHTTNLSVKEIANKLGFEDPNYFTTFFKKIEKNTPAAYRSAFV